MNVEIMTEAAQFPEKEYINGIFVAVLISCYSQSLSDNIPETAVASFVKPIGTNR